MFNKTAIYVIFNLPNDFTKTSLICCQQFYESIERTLEKTFIFLKQPTKDWELEVQRFVKPWLKLDFV